METCTIRYGSPRSFMYNREPSVAATLLETPSRVSCAVANTLGGGGEELSHANVAARTTITSTIATDHCQLNLRAGATPATASTFPDVVSRFSRFKSARSSAADWQRMSRSFSNALLMTYPARRECWDSAGLEPPVHVPESRGRSTPKCRLEMAAFLYTSRIAPHQTRTGRCEHRVPCLEPARRHIRHGAQSAAGTREMFLGLDCRGA